ncbi:MAG: mannose-1-phosphate guanylyltransferase [Gammaproteobacteria bacterium CG22_combo_CG10-13_8_21_14_all_40_8]|nr:MAG: mannose-1-phosphate guanylyltransferase [Gammaproteobacteria bacterium CG22_combo_CG10-13_8_21_14_all_40_8]
MKAMILAAGRGERFRPITDTLPKPLISVCGKPLIFWHLEALAQAGIHEVVVNISWLGQQIKDRLTDGQAFGVHIQYSEELVALESAGGIQKALKLLGTEPFLVINADIWCDYPLQNLIGKKYTKPHLILVDNPNFNPSGDFSIQQGLLQNCGDNMLTFSGISVYPLPFAQQFLAEKGSIVPYLRKWANQKSISAEHYDGKWYDVGTIERLQKLEQDLKTSTAH